MVTITGQLTAVYDTLEEYTAGLAKLDAHPMTQNVVGNAQEKKVVFDYYLEANN